MAKLSNYELLRLERIQRNNDRLARLGLLDKPRAKAARTPPKKGTSAAKKKVVSPSPIRSSRRLRQQPALHVPSLQDEEVKHNTARPHRIHHQTNHSSLTDAQKEIIHDKLSNNNFLDVFHDYLINIDKISPSNATRVMRQLIKLHNGQGLRAPHWPLDCYFLKDFRVDAAADVVALIELGVQCEDEWGKDLGNGWLYRHPLGKLGSFQRYLLESD